MAIPSSELTFNKHETFQCFFWFRINGVSDITHRIYTDINVTGGSCHECLTKARQILDEMALAGNWKEYYVTGMKQRGI
jgi:hypothetical protein